MKRTTTEMAGTVCCSWQCWPPTGGTDERRWGKIVWADLEGRG
ncbi:hypothetical protein [Streptomyces sp. NPDC002640]